MKFPVILADPPWPYRNYKAAVHGAASSSYSTMSLGDICGLPVAEWADDDCACFLWCTAPQEAQGCHLDVLDAWGFRPVTRAFSWVKTYRHGGLYMGFGRYTRSGIESVWLGVRGRITKALKNRDTREVLLAPVARHSQKPEEVQDRIEGLLDGPYLELFATRERPGWTCWGLGTGFRLDARGVHAYNPDDGQAAGEETINVP